MIPELYIREWYDRAPWGTWAMVEQDLIVSRMLVEMFNDSLISDKLIFRGGTALHKLFFPQPLRYSEDIDVVQRGPGPIGPIFDGIRKLFDQWLGIPGRKIGPKVSSLTYRIESEDSPPLPLKIKIEINTREHFQFLPVEKKKIRISSRWFDGEADIPVYCVDELLATKMRALYQRRKGRDLFDLGAALPALAVSPQRVVDTLDKYLEAGGQRISRRVYRSSLLEKLDRFDFLEDCKPFLRPGVDFAPRESFALVDRELIFLMSGK